MCTVTPCPGCAFSSLRLETLSPQSDPPETDRMVDWTSPHALNIQADAFQKLNHALAGLYFWEFLTSLDFDWAFLSDKKKLHWPMIPYFLNRYLLLFALITIPEE
ncbi:hypothetical protein QCA50_018484 [Cerrena zonata]|uniref:Uncharacterized protein n=1 Tax=Cerrena zonata TaxID=2478898 RepID=A0AAW0FHL2_9APHY